MFTVYQIHKMSGECEDYLDIIIGSYLRKERAEEVIKTLRDKEKESRERSLKCQNCPVHDYNCDFRSVINEYCEDFEEERDLYDGCKNEYYSYSSYDAVYYEIQKVDVEE